MYLVLSHYQVLAYLSTDKTIAPHRYSFVLSSDDSEEATDAGAIANLIFVEIQTAKFDNGR